MSVRDKIHAVYAKLPDIECKGLCHDSCGPIMYSGAEGSVIKGRHGEEPDYHPSTLSCKLLTKDNRCSIYEDRPFICRAYGVAEGLECQHGCKPVGGKYISKRKFFQLVDKLQKLKGKKSFLQKANDTEST